jgi:hypothetical protein
MILTKCTILVCRSQWPRGLRRGSAAVRLLGLWVRILPGAWMSVSCECSVLSGRGPCVGLITRPEESYRVWCVTQCDREASITRRPWPTGGCWAMGRNNIGLYSCNFFRNIKRLCTVRDITKFRTKDEWRTHRYASVKLIVFWYVTPCSFMRCWRSLNRVSVGTWRLSHCLYKPAPFQNDARIAMSRPAGSRACLLPTGESWLFEREHRVVQFSVRPSHHTDWTMPVSPMNPLYTLTLNFYRIHFNFVLPTLLVPSK